MLATLTVTSLADDLTVDGQLTLREAIRAAELDISVDGSAPGSGADTIVFHPSLGGVIHSSMVGDSSAGASAFLVSTPITIRGNASGITIARSIVAAEMRYFHVASTGNLTLESLTLTAGLARGVEGEIGAPNGHDGRGGAILNQGTLTIVSSTLYGNAAWGGGAALGGVAGVGRGGAVYNDGALLDIRNTTISSNATRNSDGVTTNNAYGGGVYSRNGLLTINLSTIVDNTATAGRGVYVLGDGVGKSSTLELNNSIVGNNGPIEEVTEVVVTHDHGGASFSSGVNNLVRKEVSFDGDIVSKVAPQLGPLAANGGPTWTHAILPGSPALDAGSAEAAAGQGGVPLTDQRGDGYERVADGDGVLGSRIDIGAFELRSSAEVIELPGDYNLNGIVDAADFTVWRNQLNQTVVPFFGADGDGSGLVDGVDYQLWKAHFGETLASASISAISDSTPPNQRVHGEAVGKSANAQLAYKSFPTNPSLLDGILSSQPRDSASAAWTLIDEAGDADLLAWLAIASVAEQSAVAAAKIDSLPDATGSQVDEIDLRLLGAVWEDWQPANGFLSL